MLTKMLSLLQRPVVVRRMLPSTTGTFPNSSSCRVLYPVYAPVAYPSSGLQIGPKMHISPKSKTLLDLAITRITNPRSVATWTVLINVGYLTWQQQCVMLALILERALAMPTTTIATLT